MKTTLIPFESRRIRRLIVGVAITGAAAAFAAAAVLAEVALQASVSETEATPALFAGIEAARAEQRAAIGSPDDSGDLLESPWVKGSALRADASTDASLPSAAEVLQRAAGATDEPSPTF